MTEVRVEATTAAGAHAGRTWWSPLRVLLLITAVTFALGMVQKSGCYSQTWENSESRYVQMCYSDLPYLYTGRGLAELAWPYSEDATTRDRYEVMEYPVGIAYWAYAAAWVTHWVSGSPPMEERAAVSTDKLWSMPSVHREIGRYVAVNALGFAVLALVATWLLSLVHRRRPWDAMAFAASPMLLFTGIINWDMLSVACVAGALFAWSRGRPGWTGVMIGLGTAAKLYPLFLLGALLVICWRSGRWRAFVTAVVAAAASWAIVNAPAMLSGYDAWKVFWHFNSQRGADLGSLWLAAQQITGHTLTPHTINVASWVFFGVWCLLTLAVGLMARRAPTFAELGFVIVAGFLVVNKVYSPQYVLWLLPLAALARPRLRDQVWWQSCELVYFAFCWWYLGGFLAAGSGDQQPFYWLAIAVRVLGELWLVSLIVRSWWPRRDLAVPSQPGVLDKVTA